MTAGTNTAQPAKQSSEGKESFLRRLFQIREMGVLAALVVLIIVMSIASPYFLKPDNIFNVLRGMSTIGIMAIGITMVIVTAGIDLSVGSLLAVSGMLMARMLYTGVPLLPALLLGLAIGTFLGGFDGFVITRFKVTPLIAGIGMLSIARGLTVLLATGLKGAVASNIPIESAVVDFIGSGYIGPVPMPVIEMFLLVVGFSLFLKHTVLGRQIYAVGSNAEAARLSGVNVNRVLMFVYTMNGALCAFAGIVQAGLLSTAATNAGTGAELSVVAAVVIGGTSLFGGEGSILGSIIGAAIMAIVRNAFVLLHLPSAAQTITIGLVIIAAVAVDNLRKHPGRA
jgi:ribose transport system permease protein